jgi:periplasmic protein TonB
MNGALTKKDTRRPSQVESRLRAATNPHSATLSQGWQLSATLHVLLGAALFGWIFLMPTKQPEPTVHVFMMVGPSGGTALATTTPAAESTAIQVPQLPDSAPDLDLDLDFDSLEAAIPVEAIIPETIPEPIPAPVIQKKAPAKPEAKTEAKPSEKPAKPEAQKMSYDEFVKKQGKPKTKPVAKKSGTAASNAKAIKQEIAGALKSLRLSNAGVGGGGTGGVASALDLFNQELLAKIDAAWIRPDDNLPEGLSVTVEFKVAPNGKISNVKIVKSSGNPGLDQSVKAAFNRVGNAGKPPNKDGGTYKIGFGIT